MATENELLRRITARPDVFSGKPIIRDMRISVELVLTCSRRESAPRPSWTATRSWNRMTFGPAPPTRTR